MIETVGRRVDDTNIHHKIDAVIVDINSFRQDTDSSLNELAWRINAISTDLATHKNDVAKLSDELKKVVENLSSIYDILTAWNNIQGFGKVIKFLSMAAKIIVPIVLFFGIVGTVFISVWSWITAHGWFK